MSNFGPTDERLRRVQARMPGFAVEPMRVARMIFLLHKTLRDEMNSVLRKYDLADSSYIVLAILYGSIDETSTASALSEACHEKPANLTRVCDELAGRGLIERNPKLGDRRAVMISLTDSGRALIEQALPDVSERVVAACTSVSAAELRQLADLHLRLLEGLNSGA
ncbi:MarR family winged helix-turn-helix transcriptional regulator [Massilia niastensis]|uniref:MarR family winged helix-turn-helix transcriptional regulator n=1 Tax=Massilia niastensis TaxID=544911 RepID=UPI000476668F|nr:MarR family transcriptional regulator [Massilia niastensis]